MTRPTAAIVGADIRSAPMKQSKDGSFCILHYQPEGVIEARWRACLLDSDFPTHYTAPEFFLEPVRQAEKPFAILSTADDEVTGVLTGVSDGDHVRSGLSVRPQIAFSRRADRARAMVNLIAGLAAEAESAKLVDLFVWSDMETLVAPRFLQKRYEGVVLLDLSRGPDALFRKFSENKRTNIKKAIKYGVSVEPATSREDISAYYEICVDWSHRKSLPIPDEEEFRQTFALTKNRLLLLARYKEKIIAGVVVRFFPHGVMEYAANSSLDSALRLRPNDLLHWHAIKWGCAGGLSKYSLGGTHLFLRKFGGEVLPTTRHRLDRTILRRFAIGDWIADRAERARPFIPDQLATVARSLRGRVERPRNFGRRTTEPNA
jgi:Acetyltransferase (GNAT) domain